MICKPFSARSERLKRAAGFKMQRNLITERGRRVDVLAPDKEIRP